jgi:hypothetical protein
LKWAIILACSAAAACSAIGIDIAAGAGLSYPTGQWGNSLNTGVDAELSASWIVTPSFRAGLGVSFNVFGSNDQGAASLTFFKPQLKAGYYLRPWGNVFNPGVVCAFGMSRTSLSNSGGTDPATWDPFWKMGLRWNFSVGGGFRGEVGGDFSSILAEMESADVFTLQFCISREVAI